MKKSHILKIAVVSVSSFLLIACDSDESDGNRVSLGTSNTLFSLEDIQYQEQFVVQVTNPQGEPSADVRVNFRLQPLSFNKGVYVATDLDIPADGEPDRWVPVYIVTCNSEDANNNGVLDAGEDLNANATLEPSVPAITAHPDLVPTIEQFPGSLTTDESGFGYLAVTYPKSESSWVRMRLTAEAQDGLPGNLASYNWTLHHLIADVDDVTTSPPGGTQSPYGITADCADPN